jgi:hypothetical protein
MITPGVLNPRVWPVIAFRVDPNIRLHMEIIPSAFTGVGDASDDTCARPTTPLLDTAPFAHKTIGLDATVRGSGRRGSHTKALFEVSHVVVRPGWGTRVGVEPPQVVPAGPGAAVRRSNRVPIPLDKWREWVGVCIGCIGVRIRRTKLHGGCSTFRDCGYSEARTGTHRTAR